MSLFRTDFLLTEAGLVNGKKSSSSSIRFSEGFDHAEVVLDSGGGDGGDGGGCDCSDISLSSSARDCEVKARGALLGSLGGLAIDRIDFPPSRPPSVLGGSLSRFGALPSGYSISSSNPITGTKRV